MIKLLMSRPASALLRALLARAAVPRERILLTEVRSVDWQSLTMVGERHEFGIRIPGPDAEVIAAQLCDGLGDAEFEISGQLVADIAVVNRFTLEDGSIDLAIEALTISA